MFNGANQVGAGAAIALRRDTLAVRLSIMAIIALLLGTLGGWSLALPWWLTYVTVQLTMLSVERLGRRWGGRPFYALCFISYAVAGAPTWHLWTSVGDLGIAAAAMFLCGMLIQLAISSLAAGRLFWISASPLIAYLILVPPLAFGPARWVEGLTASLCGIMLVAYLALLWRGHQKALGGIEASRVAAEAASRAKTEFLATMSHEIRTPMNAVLGAADLLERGELTAEQRGHVNMLRDGGALLMQILNDVLDLSKIEAGKLTIEYAAIDTHTFVQRCANFWTPRAQDAGLELIVDIAPDAARYVMMDATRTGQIFFNLISNALKFTAHGSVILSLATEPRGPDRCELVFSVADTGMGMAQETLDRLFTAFEQADGSITRRFGGTGLGLSIAQKLANMMGGQVSASSTQGAGSTFSLRLPAMLAQAGENAEDQAAAEEPVPQAPRRILVAEDNPANQRIIDLFLRPIGADLTIVENGRLAVDALEAQPFDVVLMDMQMPVMGGLEATRLVRAGQGPNATTPILALTANVMESHQRACEEAGMSGHISKPIDARLLIAAVLSAAHAAPGDIGFAFDAADAG